MILDKNAIDLERARQCLTVRELSNKAGVSTASLCVANKDISPVTVGRIAAALGVDPEEIIVKEER